MNNNVSVVQRCINDWASLLRTLKGKAKVTEEEEQSRAADGKEGYVEIFAGECTGRLKARLKRIQKQNRELPLNHWQQLVVSMLLETQVAVGSLPKLQLQTFDGNLEQWAEFWDIFDVSINQQQSLPAVAKFSYLKNILKGTAAVAILGVPVNNENYDLALWWLKEKFGRPENVIELLYTKLQAIPKCNIKFADIKYTSDFI